MKKCLILTIAFLGMAMSVFSQNRSINFIEGKTFAEVKEIAKKENKMIFIDFYTTWCGPCKKMDKEVYTNDSVADFYNSHFINIKIDAEKGEGVELRKKYEVQAYPTLIFVSYSGEMVHRSGGYNPAQAFIRLGIESIDPSKRMSGLLKSYKEGKRDEAFLLEILNALYLAGLADEKEMIINDYLVSHQSGNINRQIEWFIIDAINEFSPSGLDFSSAKFQYLLSNYDRLSGLLGDSIINQKIYTVLSNAVWEIVMSKPPMKHKDSLEYYLKTNVRQANPTNRFFEKEIDFLLLIRSNSQSDSAKSNLVELIGSGVIEKFNWYDWNTLQNASLVGYGLLTDRNHLDFVIKWIRRSLELKETYESLWIYAILLFKIDQPTEAILVANRAIGLATQSNNQYAVNFYKVELEKLQQLKK